MRRVRPNFGRTPLYLLRHLHHLCQELRRAPLLLLLWRNYSFGAFMPNLRSLLSRLGRLRLCLCKPLP